MDLLGRRWALRILWELRADDTGPRALLDRIEGLSSSVLYDRLRELGAAHLVERSQAGYRLTATGRARGGAIAPLSEWADHWAPWSAKLTHRASCRECRSSAGSGGDGHPFEVSLDLVEPVGRAMLP